MKLRGADAATLARAIGIAASESAGLRENFGTMTKPFHAGRAAESGIIAADMAGLGWTASSQILEAPNGFFHAAGGGYDASALTFAKPWTFLTRRAFRSNLFHPVSLDASRYDRAAETDPRARM